MHGEFLNGEHRQGEHLHREELRCARRAGRRFSATVTAFALAAVFGVARPQAAPPPAPPAPAGAAAASIPAEYAELAKKLAKALPDVQVQSVRPSGVDGIVEVMLVGNRIVYADLAGKHLFNGHLLELDTREDLTERRLYEVMRIDTKQLPLVDAFDVKRGSGKRVVYLFEDPDCPFCKKLEEELPKVNDLTLHVFLYPLASIHPHAYEHALGVWCAKDRQKAWSDKMLRGTDPPAAKCDNPLDRNLTLGDKLHIEGTPTLIFADGRVHPGTVTAEELERLLAGGS
jgi:thiol:disulfide interchange protein DsbC